jgi:hypothetical protein
VLESRADMAVLLWAPAMLLVELLLRLFPAVPAAEFLYPENIENKQKLTNFKL